MNNKKEQRLKGIPISDGIVYATVCLLDNDRHTQSACTRILSENIETEKQRLSSAIKQVSLKFDSIKEQVISKIGKSEAEIFSALKFMLTDPTVIKKLNEAVEKNLCSSESAVFKVFDEFIARFESIDDKYIKERVTDFADIKYHLINELADERDNFKCKGIGSCEHGHNRIVVAEELTPSTTCNINVETTLGFVSERGGKTSHAAIISRALGIPAVTGIPDIYNTINCGTEVLINGFTGEVILWPSEETKAQIPEKPSRVIAEEIDNKPVQGFKILANISCSKEVHKALKVNAEGIGLYRTEMEFITEKAALNEESQYQKYAEVVKAMKGNTVYFRLLDIGGDKELPFLNIQKEANPQLGCRGARLLKLRPELLATQARAIARASVHGPVAVIYPMIVSCEQFIELREMFNEAVKNISCGEILHGPMFEVPSACFVADELFAVADFASVGTNDLVQYLFAIDRGNEKLADEYNPDHPILWGILKTINEAAKKYDRPVSICGEIACDARYIPKLLEAGFKIFSAAIPSIPGIRQAIRNNS